MTIKNLLTALFILPFVGIASLLTGCGGGGGSNPVIRWSNPSPPSSFTVDGISTASDITISGDSVTDATDLGTDTGSTTATLAFAADGSINSLSLTTPNGTLSLSVGAGDTFDEDPGTGVVSAINPAETLLAFSINPLTLGWNYQSFGAWLSETSATTGTVEFASFGWPTAGANIPTTSTANFSGLSSGLYVDSTEELFVTASQVSVAADFSAQSLDFSTSSTVKVDMLGNLTAASTLDMTGTLTYTAGSNGFSGTVTTAGGLTGTSTGQFYGPNAEELGGVFSLDGPNPEFYSGAYGAIR